ncbi:hypothetical protein PHLGIDRAFT_105176 [Phlebiopsis gigantea 11061_1 CR5-6]|uniref:Uncharacterized protein n=1 Tax=Phlebiopsis gigantea (strain 11061_1 CR5-6) TaxID=745531 RepID=A0A0C3S8Y7_PHLG1|nr:hypothetical protein PHLGIDRAFT_105176 [Phlebiopsis gigantea 11061_1 CR5-6]
MTTVATSAGPSNSSTPVVAHGDWTQKLVQLAKTAELKKHALTLQLHTANILSAHAQVDEKNRAIQDVREQKNKLDSERARLLKCLSEVNEDRDKADMLADKLDREVSELQSRIKGLSEGEYAAAKLDVDRLRKELGQQPLPPLQEMIEEKSAEYLKKLRTELESNAQAQKRGADEAADGQPGSKRPRGRPKGSKNSKKVKGDSTQPPDAA